MAKWRLDGSSISGITKPSNGSGRTSYFEPLILTSTIPTNQQRFPADGILISPLRQAVGRCRQPDLTASINETMQFFPDRPIIKYGLISAFLYWTITSVLALRIDGSMLLLSFYTPGTIFGICLFLGLDTLKIRNRQFPLSIILLSTIFYAAVILFCNKNITFSIQTRHFLSGGLGAILLFLAISFSYKVNFALYDYLLAFVVGLGTTFFMWTDKFGNFNPWLMFLCIGLWQIAISFLLDRKLDKATQ